MKQIAKINNIDISDSIAVGDGANDIQMIKNYNGWIAYKKSKLCNILFTRKLSNLLKSKNMYRITQAIILNTGRLKILVTMKGYLFFLQKIKL